MTRKIDAQTTGMAGEFLTAGKLFKRGYQASITLGNAKHIDILVYNPEIDKSFVVQVKTLRKKNCFLIKKESINKEHIYVFIVLYSNDTQEEYFIVKGEDILSNIDEFFGSSYKREIPSTMPAINYNPLKKYLNNWSVFDE
jgi:hypothetical protein